jgi:hypothetical protein
VYLVKINHKEILFFEIKNGGASEKFKNLMRPAPYYGHDLFHFCQTIEILSCDPMVALNVEHFSQMKNCTG